MTENNQIVPVSFLPAQSEWAMMKDIAKSIAMANNLSEGKMISILITGRSLGLSIPASIELVQSVQGKTSLAPRGALAMLHDNPRIADLKINRLVDAQGKFLGYECYIKRQSGFEYTGRFTMTQAQAAHLVKKDGAWETYPENMCLWRAVGFAADVAASDITCGLTAFMKMPEQFGVAITEGGDIIEGHVVPHPAPPVDMVAKEVERLTALYGVEAVLNSNNGNIPSTGEECEAVSYKLENSNVKGGNDGNS